MSRLLIKNIPVNATPESLRTHLSSTKNGSLTITDLHIAKKPDGTPRRFAFVGFKSEEQATAATQYFHGTFLGSQKITVEVVKGVKDAPTPRPNKRPRLNGPDTSKGPSGVKTFTKTVSTKTTESKGDDALTTEFLSIMNPGRKGPAWADGQASNHPIPLQSEKEKHQIFTRTAQDTDMKDDPITTDNATSDLDWLKSRMSMGIRQVKDFEQSDDDQEAQDHQPLVAEDVSDDPKQVTRQTILATARLFVRNLTFFCTSEELRELFAPFGEIQQVHIPLTPEHTSKGLAFVTYANSADAVSAWEALDGTTFQGRLLHILAGVERRKDAAITEGGKKKSLKEERGEKRRKEAGKEFNWGMLYMNSDAVATSIADRMNISKADILGASESEEGGTSHNPAVKLALAETHVIQETRRYFEDQGVVLESLANRSTPRSRTIILVKNIPYGTTTETLRTMFEPHGVIARLLIPPSGTLAVVEYTHIEEASRAFRALAYRRLGNSIVYLEWAPEGLLVDDTARGSATAVKPVTIPEQEEKTVDEQLSIRRGSTLFVKNLSFTTTTERFAAIFRNLPSFSFARIQMKPSPANHKVKAQPEQEKLSMGYGFVGFADPEAAQKALKSMQGFVLDGHKLHVTFAGRGADNDDKQDLGIGKAKTTKMIVKNVPFEASKKDIRDLFGVYGTLKSVRLPKNFDARARGFAFLDFVSRQEAENAFSALRHTHLLGRHLVLDWATEGEQDVEALRRKVGVGFGKGGELPGRKRKLDIAVDGGEDEDV
ncbi:hypothetical protein BU17DRAFT_57223 [Hysterangium stoloniferum]|nr:hypothetical protein BU17DRAFT_57223 [Hysterangium stoloniferum]